ncbi:MAG: formyltransferase family protein [Proteobacteria bacterium]|nr:formyltransferase family protein [Pseudomonadota bacterium]
MTSHHIPIVVALSGGGRSLANLLAKEQHYCFKVVGVITSHQQANGVKIAQQAQLPIFMGTFQRHKKKHQQHTSWQDLQTFLNDLSCALVVLAGFLRPYPMEVANTIQTINIHPSLLPKYGGKGLYGDKVHEMVLKGKERVSGATCHEVSEEYDKGKVISQVVVSIHKNDTVKSLAARVFAYEKQLLPITIDHILSQKNP